MYNKHQFKKLNDKKLLHKVGKHWVTVSIALLGLLCGGAAATHIRANANVTDNNSNQANHQMNINQLQNSKAILHTNSQSNHSSQYVQNSHNQIHKNVNINNKINELHNRIINNNIKNQNNLYRKSTLSNPSNINNLHIKYLMNNAAYDTSANSFTNVDDFLTARSWYRPRMIHQGGTTWRYSQQASPNDYHDFRPILMNWWPNKSVQVAYLNYMNKQGIIPNNYNLSSPQEQLDMASYDVQNKIEQQISKNNNNGMNNDTKKLFNNFINSQSEWNRDSEDPVNDGLQGGFLKFNNNPLTPKANSNYRLFGRDATENYGNYDRYHNNNQNMELLLGNDIDNSNPAVQAEDLNNLYYINNIGKILDNNTNGGFDGFREDATGSMDYDFTDIISEYLNARYHMNNDKNADAHLAILEDGANWVPNLHTANNHQGELTQDEDSFNALLGDLLNSPKGRETNGTNLGFLIYNDGSQKAIHTPNLRRQWYNRSNDYTEDQLEPNYSRFNTHDNGTFLSTIIDMAKHNNSNWNQMNSAERFNALETADKQYDNQESKVNKIYDSGQQQQQYYNIPSAYAWMLTNKDTVPEIYYGDIYNTYAPYMSSPNPYFNAVKALLEDRRKFVAGGQQMNMYGINGKVNGPGAFTYKGILSSVRFGKDNNFNSEYHQILKPNDDPHSSNDPTTGIAVIIGEDPTYRSNEGISVFMGAAHKDQTYRPSLVSTKSGIDINDMNPSLRLTTDNKGYLNIPAKYLEGVANPLVSGNLSVWVPASAPDNQDARIPENEVSNTPHTDGNIYHSNAALDSHVLFESFSPLMPITDDRSEQLDTVISKPQSINLLKDMGITDLRFPPHYHPLENDASFVDTIDHIGYAFKDRYDMNNTKYGTVQDLINANSTLHNNGIHTLADVVDNQVYDLANQEVVPVTRTDAFGNNVDSQIMGKLYADNTISSTNEPQYKYGGAFLKILQKRYPKLFAIKQLSSGKSMVSNEPIKQWSAKYMNGSSIQNYGIGNVLKDSTTNKYYTVNNNGNSYIPDVFNFIKQRNNSYAQSGAESADAKIESSIASSYAKSANDSIANYYKDSVANSVAKANQAKAKSVANSVDSSIDNSIANSAAISADNSIDKSIASSVAASINNSIATSESTSVSNSISALDNSIANSAAKSANNSIANKIKNKSSLDSYYASSAAKSADESIANSYRNSVITSVSKANQSRASSAANLADKSIENSIAESYAQSTDNSIANSYKNSVSVSASSLDKSLAASVAKLVNSSIAASYSNSASLSASTSASESVSASTALSNSIKFNAHASASGIIRNDINEINSYNQTASHNDSTAVNELNDINVSSNASLSALKSNDVSEAYDDNSIVNEDISLVGNFNNELQNGSYEPSLAINSANSQVTAASAVANDANLIIKDDITALRSLSSQARSSSNYSTSNNNSSNSNSSAIASSAKNTINTDQAYFSVYYGQIDRAVNDPNVRSNILASLQISNDSKVASSANQMISNDQLSPSPINASNANKELSSVAVADSNAQQVITSVMSSEANSSTNTNHNTNSSNNSIINSNENNIIMDKIVMNNDASQINQYARNPKVLSNPLALSMINRDSSVAASADQTVTNDQLNPTADNTSNASNELSVATLANQEAQQVASSAVNSAVSASAANRSNSNHNTTPNNVNPNGDSNSVKPQNPASSSNSNSNPNANHNNVTPSPSNDHQSIPSSTPSDNPDSNKSGNDDNSDVNSDNNANGNDTENDNTDANNGDSNGKSNNIPNANSDNAVNGTQQQTNGNNNTLPQTDESSHGKAIAAALLALGSLGLLLDDKKRYYNW